MKHRMIYYSFFIIILIANNVLAQEIPPINELVKRIEMVCLPNSQYKVSVSQKIDIANSKIKTPSISNNSEKIQSNFNCIYNPQTGLKVNNDQNINSKKIQSINEQQTNFRITVNFVKLLKNFNSWKEVNIISDDLNSENCYKITAQDNSYEYIIWVDAVNYYISKIILNIKGQEFAEINITYNYKYNKYWLPSKIIINQAIDATQITQNFSEYIFN